MSRRRAWVLALAGAVLVMTGRAHARQPGGTAAPGAFPDPAAEPAPGDPTVASPPSPAAPAPEDAAAEDQATADLPVGDQELGVRLGLQLALAGISTGGVRVGGVYLTRLTERLWAEGEADVIFGGTSPQCYMARDGSLVCDPGPTSGFGFRVAAGFRWFAAPRGGGFQPYVRALAGVGLGSLLDDEVSGLGVLLEGGGGGRLRISEQVAIGAELLVGGGVARWSEGVGVVGHLQLTALVGVEIALP